MKSDYLTRAKKFIDQIAPYFSDCSKCEEYKAAVAEFNREHHRKVLFSHGISRVVMITSDYVVKVDYDYNSICKFGGCRSEVRFYQFAEEKGYAYLLAKITPICVNGMFFYVMPRIYGIGRYENYVQEYLDWEDADFVDEYIYDTHDQNYGWKDGHPVIIDYACNALTFPPLEVSPS